MSDNTTFPIPQIDAELWNAYESAGWIGKSYQVAATTTQAAIFRLARQCGWNQDDLLAACNVFFKSELFELSLVDLLKLHDYFAELSTGRRPHVR
jgi:hypothetical protein